MESYTIKVWMTGWTETVWKQGEKPESCYTAKHTALHIYNQESEESS